MDTLHLSPKVHPQLSATRNSFATPVGQIKFGSFDPCVLKTAKASIQQSSEICFGKFSFPLQGMISNSFVTTFVGKKFKALSLAILEEKDQLLDALDLWQANYLEADIMYSLGLRWLPGIDVSF